jgi:uridine kinase
MSHVIAFAGHPGAGKSSVVRGLVQALGDACAVHMDNYETMTRTAIEDIAQWMKDGADIDAFSFPQLELDLQSLKRNEAVLEPRTTREVLPRKYVLFETQFGRAHRATGRHVDLLVWIDTPLDVALARNVRKLAVSYLREQQPARLAERLQWLIVYLDNYVGTVRALMPMQKEKVAAAADIVIDGQPPLADVVQNAKNEILRRLP